ncbi:hypothetical protein MG293_011332 [Ovis ammon polii]|uniref:Uncharacterized protein n=1 Tax=Ovis ammon polii TaxID=230172 RepID=A0AAD4U4N8_OVIAM|nr:hypothetical protein MG293_011332 [Ovis ammon polii]
MAWLRDSSTMAKRKRVSSPEAKFCGLYLLKPSFVALQEKTTWEILGSYKNGRRASSWDGHFPSTEKASDSHTCPPLWPRFEARKARSMKHNLVQLSSSEIHACSCPNGAVILSSKPDFSSYSPAERQQMTYFYKQSMFVLSVSTEIKKVKPNFAKPEVLPKESHYKHLTGK